MPEKEIRLFNQGMNKDSDVRLLKNGEYIDALNIRAISTDNGRDGSIENVKSNVLKDDNSGVTYVMPDGVNRCINSIEDEVNKRTFWFVWNSDGEHLILIYNQKSDTIQELIKDNDYTLSSHNSGVYDNTYTSQYKVGDIVTATINSVTSYYECKLDHVPNTYGNAADRRANNVYLWEKVGDYLDFKEDKLIQSRLVNKDGETMLFWTDDYDEEGNERVRYINVDKYLNDEYPTSPKKEYFDVAPNAPLFRPRAESRLASNVDASYFRGKFFQIKQRYIYIDGQPSSWSPVSQVINYTHNSLYTSDFDNALDITVDRPDGLTSSIVKKIEVAARECGNGNSGDWYTIKSIDTSLTDSFIFDANTDVSLGSDTITITAQPYETGQSVLYDNKGGTSLGGLTSGSVYYISVNSSTNTVKLSTTLANALAGTDINITTKPTSEPQQLRAYESDISYSKETEDNYGVNLGSDVSPFTYIFTWYNNDSWTAIALDEAEYDFCSIPQNAKAIEIMNDNRLSLGNTTIGYDIDSITPDITPSDSYTTVSFTNNYEAFERTFKKGCSYDVGMRYSDGKGRVSTVIVDRNIGYSQAIEWTSDTNAAYNKTAQIQLDIGHQPPSWAKTWQPVVRPASNIAYQDSTPDFLQFAQCGLNLPATLNNLNSIYGAGNYRLYSLGCVSAFEYDHYDNVNINYGFTPSDRYRQYSTGTAPQTDAASYIDKAIAGQEPITTGAEIFANVLTTTTPSGSDLAEFYTTTNTQSSIWYEMGQAKMCGIDQDNELVHLGLSSIDTSGVDQNTNTSTDAVTLISDADCYLGYIKYGEPAAFPIADTTRPNTADYYCECAWLDFAFNSRSNDRGRINILSESYGRYKTQTRVQFSQPIVQESERTEFSLMYDGDIVDNNNQFGSLQLMYQMNQSLYLFQEDRIGYRPVARQIIEDLESQQLVGISGEILGDVNYLPYEYGISVQPESFAVYGSDMFCVDADRAAVLKIRGSQIENIAERGMKFYFDSALQAARFYNRPFIYGGYDKEFSEYIVAFNYRDIQDELTVQQFGSSVVGYDFSWDNSDFFFDQLLFYDFYNAAGLPSEFLLNCGVRYIDSSLNYYTEANGVFTEYDEVYGYVREIPNSLNITVAGDPTTNAVFVGATDTVAFNNNAGRWSTRYSYAPEFIGNSGVKPVTFKDGELYLHNSGSTYDQFYGTQYTSKIKFAFNAANNQNKIYNTIGLNSNDSWAGELENERGQASNIITSDYEQLEGKYWADVLMDTNTPVEGDVTNPITQGDILIDDHLIIELEQEDQTALKTLYSVTGTYNISNTLVIG